MASRDGGETIARARSRAGVTPERARSRVYPVYGMGLGGPVWL